jgi:uncharacterized membrane protein SpoIIM required for sporulation
VRERSFISQNKEKWKELEELLKEDHKDADRLSRLFIQVTDDLSYARTFYPNRFVRIYLNSIAQKLFYLFYKNRTTGKKRFINYWKTELPKLIYSARKELLFSLIVFIIAFVIGVVSTSKNPQFASAILGKDYVKMTLENIKKGDPMGVYKDKNAMAMYWQIASNNLIVSFFAFIGGLFFGVGSFGIILYNGIMVGVFQYFFYRYGLFMTSFQTIWLHGTLEMSSMVIASAAGITMGKGIIFPGTYTRLQSFFLSARKGLKILLGVLPLIIIAATIESFLSRHTEAPAWTKLAIIFTSLGFIVFYFIVYPYLVYREDPSPPEDIALHEAIELKYDLNSVYSNGMIISQTFNCLKQNAGKILRLSFLAALAFTAIYYFVFGILLDKNPLIPERYLFLSVETKLFFNYDKYPVLFICNTIALTIIFQFLIKIISKTLSIPHQNSLNKILQSAIWIAIINALFFLNTILAVVILFIVLPYLIQWYLDIQLSKRNMGDSFTFGIRLMDTAPGKAYGFLLVVVFVSMVVFVIIDTPFVRLFLEVLQWNFPITDANSAILSKLIEIFMAIFSFVLVLPLFIFGHYLQYFSLREIYTASGIAKKIERLKAGI